MIAKAPQYVQHITTGKTAQIHNIVPSPYGTEAERGIKRAQVRVEVLGSDGHKYQTWDFWLLDDCIVLPKAPIESGVTVTVRYHKALVEAVVMDTNYADICVMLADGKTGWMSLTRVKPVATDMPANTAASIA